MAKEIKVKKKGFDKKFLLLLLAVPILVALGVVVGGYISSQTAEKEVVVEKEVLLPEMTVTLDEFLLNLEPSGNINRYIRLELSLSTTKKNGVKEIEENIDKIRDVIIYKISRESVETIFEDEEKSFTLKYELRDDINNALGEDLIHQIYISNIVIQ